MRTIKFRIWNGLVMVYEVTVGIHGIFYTNGISTEDSASLDNTTMYPQSTPLMQFTGLKDKNGKEIYEGDIVLFQKKNHEIRYFTNHGMFGLVGENSYSSNMIDESKPMGSRGSSTNYKPYVLNEYYQKRIEVIGNIHENPELLK